MRAKILFLFALCLSVWQARGQSPVPARFSGNIPNSFPGTNLVGCGGGVGSPQNPIVFSQQITVSETGS